MSPELTDEQKKTVAERIHRSACFQRTFKGVDGEFVLKQLDLLVGYKSSVFDSDPYQHAYNAGQRSVAVFIHNCINQDVNEAQKLLKEK
ncbi:MAG: Bbp19 family protein [Planctomycetota bacterium]|jgi:hypothetical protein